jgi:hypothetical protein
MPYGDIILEIFGDVFKFESFYVFKVKYFMDILEA